MAAKSNRLDALTLLLISCVTLVLIVSAIRINSHRSKAALQEKLGQAIDKGQNLEVRRLLAEGADPKAFPDPTMVLVAAVIYCDPATAEALIKKGIDVNGKTEGDLTPLHYAIIHRRCDMVETLLHHGADVTLKSSTRGFTPLQAMHEPAHTFARHDNDSRLQRLLETAETQARRKRPITPKAP
jgi:ankyrin repeat protein